MTRPIAAVTRRAAAGLVCWLVACTGHAATAPAEAAPVQGATRVLFVGNSLTYTNDLPAMAAALARAHGDSLVYRTVARPNFSLEDHINTGLERIIRDFGPDVVIMQQGPSSLPDSRTHLVEWSRRVADLARGAGGRPALLMVWPPQSRIAVFDDVRASYSAAAAAAGGELIPAGDTWREAWRADPDLALYGSDGFHPSRLGTLAAALTVDAVLFESATDAATCSAPACPELPAATLAVLRGAAARATRE